MIAIFLPKAEISSPRMTALKKKFVFFVSFSLVRNIKLISTTLVKYPRPDENANFCPNFTFAKYPMYFPTASGRKGNENTDTTIEFTMKVPAKVRKNVAPIAAIYAGRFNFIFVQKKYKKVTIAEL